MQPEPEETQLLPPPAPVPEGDALPEHTAYADTGCDVLDRAAYPSCLACPLATCIHDVLLDRTALAARASERRQLVRELAQRGRTPQQIARALHTSRRTVQRDLRTLEVEGKREGADGAGEQKAPGS